MLFVVVLCFYYSYRTRSWDQIVFFLWKWMLIDCDGFIGPS